MITRHAIDLYREARGLEANYIDHLRSAEGCRGGIPLPFTARCEDCSRYLESCRELGTELGLPPYATGPMDIGADDESCPWPAGTMAHKTWPAALELKRAIEEQMR